MEKQNKNSGPEICGDKFIEHATHECVRSGLGDDTLMNIRGYVGVSGWRPTFSMDLVDLPRIHFLPSMFAFSNFPSTDPYSAPWL